MNFEELLASYNQIDQEYRARFHDIEEWYPGIDEDRGGKVFTGRKMKAGYVSFIPNKEEVEKILLEPLRRMQIEQ